MVMRDLNIGTKVGLALLNDRWYALVLSNLTDQPADFMLLRRRVRGLGTLKLLTVLAKMNQLGLVTEREHYRYQLTTTGLELQRSLQELEAWGNRAITAMH
ncbi:HxlR family transcriptional regulator [Lactiplantibacillus garii]|uniref:HxlR family transcriptional regulator n=1 Tax=Lactiplantibacillus garii TaxID=2306423 RepID=A0A3R8L1A6_9LACO|nr:winged helix-turn-helix transcriptional regulator [Lactiplantibacillus garii]RRK10563.1 HxlR family transcriptional regulator [Lactiplantibacillus garii]